MKASLTRESGAARPERPLTLVRPAESARDGFAMTPWGEGLPIWRTALGRLPGASFYHSETWIDAIATAYKLKLEVATLQRQGQLRAAAVFARSKKLFSTRLVSLPFSDSAVPLATDDESRAELLCEVIDSYPNASIEVRGIAGPQPWQNVECFAQWSLDATRPFDQVRKDFGRTVKNGINRATRDEIAVECGLEPSHLARFFDLQLVTRRRLGVPPQPYRFFETVREHFCRGGNIEIWLASLNGRDHAAIVLLRAGNQLCVKWSARAENSHPSAVHFLSVKMVEAHAGNGETFDFGRCDTRNVGLARSKADLGCVSRPAPYAFYPKAPANISSEVLSGSAKTLSSIWKRMPLPATRVLGNVIYRFMA